MTNRSSRAVSWIALSALLLALAAAPPALAGEGGGSHYLPGSPGDFAMALIGPAGFYARNDVVYFKGDIGSVTLGDRIYSSASQDVWIDVLKLIWLAEGGIAGGRLGLVVTTPIVINAKVAGTLVSPFQREASGSRSGFSDVTLTSFLNWSFGNTHLSTGLSVFFPVGAYDADRIINLGRNYWSFDPVIGFTWLDPKRGHEVSVNTGFMFNTTNEATNYSSGTEWHMDFLVGQHFSKRFAVGLAGSLLQGLTDDSGPLLVKANVVLKALGLQPLGGFRAGYFGLGPSVVVTPKVWGKDLNLIAKYLFDVEHRNRFNSDYLTISAVIKF